ncbi:MAG TPA: hypothetical protein VK508_21940 [Cyclobacteriaceae bacterium]|nr:hypothetical protein [Cyclobacteriaceae bacterium]
MRILAALSLCTASFAVDAQVQEFATPVELAAINSDAEELSPLLSPDGKSLYFARAFHPANTGGSTAGIDIWVAKQDNRGNWQPPTNDLPWNNKDNNCVVGVRNDPQIVYLLNTYTKKNGIAFSKEVEGQWSDPQPIPIENIGRNKFIGFYMNPAFNILLISMHDPGSVGEEDLYVSLKDSVGVWSTPFNLGPTINTAGYEISPYLSPDGRQLYFSSDGHGGMGDADIFVSERLYNDSWTVWTKPRNLGAPVNSDKFDAYFSMYGDSVSYFTSNRSGTAANIYSSRVKAKTIVQQAAVVSLKYVDPAEVLKTFGSQLILYFQPGTSELSPNQKNTLARVKTGLSNNKDIYCRLIALTKQGEQDLEIHKERLIKTLDEFRRLGIEGSRFTFSTEPAKSIDEGNLEAVKLMFYR